MTTVAILLSAITILFLKGCGNRNEGSESATSEASPESSSTVASEKNPVNIVVIMLDDLDVRSVETLVQRGWMPSLKKYFVDSGITFTESFVTNSLCCPSRATFLTGQYSHNHRVFSNTTSEGGGVTALEDSETLGVWLQRQGYITGHIGKYLNEYGIETEETYIPPGWNEWHALVDWSTYNMYNYKMNENGDIRIHLNEYQTDLLGQRASELIQKYSTRMEPLFFVVTPLAVHLEGTFSALLDCTTSAGFQLTVRPSEKYAGTLQSISLPRSPSFNEEEMSDKPYWLQEIASMSSNQADCAETIFQNRLEALRSADDLIKTIVEALEATKRLDNTVLIFTSDNGYLLGEHRLNQYKSYAYEESIRVPLYLRVPDSSGSEEIQQIVLNNDLAPTIVDLADATPGIPVDGRSLIPLLEDPERSDWRKRFLIENYGIGDMYPPTFSAIRTGSRETDTPNHLYVMYVYVMYEDEENSRELYDLSNDPYQLESLHNAENYGAQRETLEKWLLQLKECGNGSCQSLESSD